MAVTDPLAFKPIVPFFTQLEVCRAAIDGFQRSAEAGGKGTRPVIRRNRVSAVATIFIAAYLHIHWATAKKHY